MDPKPESKPAAKAAPDLKHLEYPRYLYKPSDTPDDGQPIPARRVEDEAELRAALADGWLLDANDSLKAAREAAKAATDAAKAAK